MPWARFETAREYKLAGNGDAVGPVEGDSADVEDTEDGGIGTEGDQVDDDAEDGRDPDGV